MSNVAVRIRYNAGSLPLTDVDFYENEIGRVDIYEGRRSNVLRLGTGKPREVRWSGYGTIDVTFRLHSSATITRLLQLEECAYDEFWIYWNRISDPGGQYYRGLLPRGQIPDAISVAGRNSGLEEITVRFLEVTKVTGGYPTGEDGEYMDDIDETSPTDP